MSTDSLPDLQIKTVVRADHVLVRGVGELDIRSGPALGRSLASIIADTSGAIVIDLSGTSFVDSSGLAMLVKIERDAEAAGRDLVLRHLRPQMLRLLELTGTLTAFTIES